MSSFTEDVLRWKTLYATLLTLRTFRSSFEERFHLLDLHFPLEQVRREKYQPTLENRYTYCFFVNQKGIYHLSLAGEEAVLAQKIKEQVRLSHEEKVAALFLLRKLAIGPGWL